MQLSKLIVKYQILILAGLLIIGFLVRLYRFDGPIADWQSWRQADTSAVSRNFVSGGFDLFHPRFDDLSNVPTWPLNLENPNGYRFVEFPLYNVFQAGFFKVVGLLTIEEWGRMVSMFASIFSSIFIFLIIRKRFGVLSGIFSSFFFLFIPYNIYYSRTILPDPSMVTATLGGIWFFDKWLEKEKFSVFSFQFSVSLVLVTAALLIKPYALFFILPMVFLLYEKFDLGFIKKWQIWFFLIISLIPLVFWRIWMIQFPEGIPASNWLFNGNNIRFKPSFFYWIFYKRLLELILGYFGIIIIIFSFLKKYKRKDLYFILSFVLSSLIYVFVLATGNVQHDYYQILVIPSISIVLGIGSEEIVNRLEKVQRYLGILVFILLVGLSFYFSWNLVKDYFNINNPSIIVAGNAVDKLTPKNAKIIANYNGDTAFLYQTKRKGWASLEKPFPQMISMGADFLVLVNPTAADLALGKTYKIITQTNEYVIFNLRQKP